MAWTADQVPATSEARNDSGRAVPPGGKTGKVTATVQLPGLAHDSAETVAIR